jgi:hypothetical protein
VVDLASDRGSIPRASTENRSAFGKGIQQWMPFVVSAPCNQAAARHRYAARDAPDLQPETPSMTRLIRCLMLPLVIAACAGEEEGPKVEGRKPTEGRWLAKVRTAQLTFVEDTLELGSGGTGRAHRLEFTLAPNGLGRMDSTMHDFGSKPITWEIVQGPLDRDLCITGQTGPDPQCGPLHVVSDSVFNLGNFVYRLIEGRPF